MLTWCHVGRRPCLRPVFVHHFDGSSIWSTDVTTIVANQKIFDDVGLTGWFASVWSATIVVTSVGQIDEPSKWCTKTGLKHGWSTVVTSCQHKVKTALEPKNFTTAFMLQLRKHRHQAWPQWWPACPPSSAAAQRSVHRCQRKCAPRNDTAPSPWSLGAVQCDGLAVPWE
jgi:hypothetical protein